MSANPSTKHRPWATRLLAFAALALLGAPAAAGPVKAEAETKPEVKQFKSGGKEITVECFSPKGEGKHPVLVTLHAVDGIEGAGPLYREAARAYAGQGYVVLLVNYFDRTGSAKKDVAGYRELFYDHFRRTEHKDEEVKRINALTDEWTATVRDAVDYARTRSDVDGERVGLVGFSLGGTVALAAAARYDLKLAALVELFGTLPRDRKAGLKNLPPTLILHGEEDKVVPADEAYWLIGLMTAKRLPCEAEVYPGVHHMFYIDGKELQRGAVFIASLRTGAFLRKHLKPQEAARPARPPSPSP